MAWSILSRVQVAQEVLSADFNGIIDNMIEDDVAHVQAEGDIIYASSGRTAARLPIGTTGQVLTSIVGGIEWADLPAADDDEELMTWSALRTALTGIAPGITT